MFWLVFAVLIYALGTVGRLVAAQPPYRRESFTLASAACVGYGVFASAWLLGQPLLGAGPWMQAAAFVFLAGVLAGATYQQWHMWPREQHHLSHVLLAMIVALPLLRLALGVEPSGESFWHQAAVAQWLGGEMGWPNVKAATLALPPVPGWLPLLVPLSGLGELTALPVVLINIGCLLAASGALLVALNWPVKWSNLPLVTAGSLALVALANPWLPLWQGLTTQSALPAALCLLAAALPLVNPMPLPGGVSVLGPALSLVALTLLHPLGWVMSLWLAVVWKLRALAEGITSADHARRSALAMTLLVTLPTLAWAGWQYVLQGTPHSVAPLLTNPWHFVQAVLTQMPVTQVLPVWANAVVVGGLIVFIAAALRPVWGRSATSGRYLFTTYAAFWVPLLLAGVPLLLVAAASPSRLWHVLEVQQFVWMLPLAAWIGQGYRRSAMRERLYHAPWAYGTVACAAVFALMLWGARMPLTPATPWEEVAGALRAHPLVMAVGLPTEAFYRVRYGAGGSQVVNIPVGEQASALALAKQHSLPVLAPAAALHVAGTAPLVLFQLSPAGGRVLAQWNITP